VPTIWRPGLLGGQVEVLPELDVVPRPAMFVAIVMALRCPRPGHDLRLALVVLGVQHLVLEARAA